MENQRVFALVVGSGFAGSLIAWILQKQGRNVILIDRGSHPRFAIGESSTPTADFFLAHLADRWNLPEIAPLACWGTWKRAYPELRCGKKRGFSYYRHVEGESFQDDTEHRSSLLVAASSEDLWSDTQWLRQDVDQFFFEGAKKIGVTTIEGGTVSEAVWEASHHRWRVEIESTHGERHSIEASWLIDASGGGKAIAQWVGQVEESHWMETRTSAVYGHFTDVRSFSSDNYTAEQLKLDPFFGDDAAQHHLFDCGWFWMIRFDHGVTSVGLVQPESCWRFEADGKLDCERAWNGVLDRYPGIAECMRGAKLVAPESGLRFQPRLSRCMNRAAGKNWLALPGAYGFIDPLHSTGIAHSLSGVLRAAEILLGEPSQLNSRLETYSNDLAKEIRWLDLLVSGCYRGLPSFERFVGFGTFYFLAAIAFEKQMSRDPSAWPMGYLQCKDAPLLALAQEFSRRLNPSLDACDTREWIEGLRRAIVPWNQVGLLDPALANRLKHTTAPKYASIASRQTY